MKEPSQEFLREVLDYDQQTGVFTWRERHVSTFRNGAQSAMHNCNAWNGKFAGKSAGHKRRDGYVKINFGGVEHYAHRLAWIYVTGSNPENRIDHADGNPTNNAFDNLRQATVSENNQNQKIAADNRSGFKGVYFHEASQKWAAEIRANKKKHYLGLFLTPEDAHAAYCMKAKELHGKFARLA